MRSVQPAGAGGAVCGLNLKLDGHYWDCSNPASAISHQLSALSIQPGRCGRNTRRGKTAQLAGAGSSSGCTSCGRASFTSIYGARRDDENDFLFGAKGSKAKARNKIANEERNKWNHKLQIESRS